MARRKSRRRNDEAATEIKQPIQQLRNVYAPIEVLSSKDLDLIHDGSMRILEGIGLGSAQ